MENSGGQEPLAPRSDDRGPMLLQVQVALACIAAPVLSARVCACIKHHGRLRLDDYLMILSLVSAPHEMLPGPALYAAFR